MAGRARRGEEESIYDWARLPADQQAPRGPKVKTYSVAAPPAQPKPKMHADSSQVEALLNPVRGIRDAQARAGITPTDHARHNRLAIKEASRLNALSKAAAAEGAAADAAQQFRPRLLARPRSGGGAGAAGGSSGGSRRASGGSGQAMPGAIGGGGGRDFVAENKVVAAAASRPVKAQQAGSFGPCDFRAKAEYGQVPAYLLERKLQLAAAQEARQAARQAAQIPPGLRLLPEDERLSTLALLEANRADVEARLAALPIITHTPSQVRHKDELERRLRELEEARRTFSRPQVFVSAKQPQPQQQQLAR